MLYAQFTHSLGLNDVCDALRANRSRVACIRGATPPRRNGLSHANKKRSSKMAEELFWTMSDYLQSLQPGFGGTAFRKLPRRFKRTVYAIDSTTLKLFANCNGLGKAPPEKGGGQAAPELEPATLSPGVCGD